MTPIQGWRNRIVGAGELPAGEFLANESNWRAHPRNQQDALKDVLEEVGFVQDVIVNIRSGEAWGQDQGVQTLVDGHLRVTLALRQGEDTPVPVKYVDLLPDEEALVLQTLDPLAALAAADRVKLAELMNKIQTDRPALQAMLERLATKEGLIEPPDPMDEYQGMPEFVQEEVEREYHTIKVHFATAADLDAFAALLGQTVTEKSKYIWYPEKEREDLKKYRMVDEP